MWKPGQIVTIKRKRYRIVKLKREYTFIKCINCDLFDKNMCDICKSPNNCYLKELHPKSQEG